MSQSSHLETSSLRGTAGAHDAAAAARPNRKAERTSAVAQNFIWREKHVGKDGVALVDGTMTRTTPQVFFFLAKSRSIRGQHHIIYVTSEPALLPTPITPTT